MKKTRKISVATQGAASVPQAGNMDAASSTFEPRKLTIAENAFLTVKVLAGLGLIGAALWAIGNWTAAR